MPEFPYVEGGHNAICDRCGFKYKNHHLRLEWTGLRVCAGAGTNHCWEVRHPQEKIRGKADRQSPPWVRPDTGDDTANETTPEDL